MEIVKSRYGVERSIERINLNKVRDPKTPKPLNIRIFKFDLMIIIIASDVIIIL